MYCYVRCPEPPENRTIRSARLYSAAGEARAGTLTELLAAVATALGIRLEKVSVIPTATSLGHCRYRVDPPRGAVLRSDTAKALSILRLSQDCSGCHETRRHFRRLRQRAQDLVRAELFPIHHLAEALRQRRQLACEEAEQILAAARAKLAQTPAGCFQQPIASR